MKTYEIPDFIILELNLGTDVLRDSKIEQTDHPIFSTDPADPIGDDFS